MVLTVSLTTPPAHPCRVHPEGIPSDDLAVTAIHSMASFLESGILNPQQAVPMVPPELREAHRRQPFRGTVLGLPIGEGAATSHNGLPEQKVEQTDAVYPLPYHRKGSATTLSGVPTTHQGPQAVAV